MTAFSKTGGAYEAAGVSIEAGNALVERIKPLAAATKRAGLMGGIGGFGGLFDVKAAGYHDPILVAATDGVGTKLKLAQAANRHDAIGIDLVAMCVNDLIVQGAEPLFFLDYFATSALDVEVAAQVVAGIAEGCRQAGAALIGGETAEMPGMYQAGEYDLAGFAVGAVEREAVLPREVAQGDVILGLASNGVHSNGYSLVRHILAARAIDLRAPEHRDLQEKLLAPTRIYVRSCLAAIRAGGVNALAHITGGGLTENIPRILPQGLAVRLETWPVPELFRWLQRQGDISEPELRRTFNCGIGMTLIVAPARADALAQLLHAEGETVFRLGEIIAAEGNDVVRFA